MKNAIALGSFDGLHTGHRAVLTEILDLHSVVVTFRVPPKTIGTDGGLLMTPEDKVEALKDFGVEEIYLLDFNKVKEQEPEEFLEFLVKKFKPERIVCGFNYRFGRGAAGNAQTLLDFCRKNEIEAKVVESVTESDSVISSTAIRDLLGAGEIEKANEFLYRDFSFSAKVLHGDARGRTLGFPTVNQKYPKELVPLKNGVYAVEVAVGDRIFGGVANIGYRPTFETEEIFSETFLFDFSGDLYGKTLTVHPKKFLREERRFSGEKELQEAVAHDIAAARKILGD